MPVNVWLLNLIVLGVIVEADLGRRKIGWFRVLRPLISTALIVPLVLTSVPTTGHDLALQAIGVAAGVLLGLAAHLFMSVGFDPAKGTRGEPARSGTRGKPARSGTRGKPARSGTSGRPVSRAGFGYAAFWAVIFAGRLVFIYGTSHWFPGPLGQFMAAHQLSAAGLTDALIFMAVAMSLARSALLGRRGRAATRRVAASTAEPAASSVR